LTKFDISKNAIMAEGGKALAAGLKGNQVMAELNIANTNLSNNGHDMSGVAAVADTVSGMGALTKLIFGGDKWYNGEEWATHEPATLEVGMVEADFSNKGLTAAGAVIIAAWISHKDMGALIKLDIRNNRIGAEQEQGLHRICVAGGIELAK
jgi:hypothetical protein